MRCGEVADAGMGHVGGLVGRHHVVPDAHPFLLSFSPSLPLSPTLPYPNLNPLLLCFFDAASPAEGKRAPFLLLLFASVYNSI